MFLSSPLFSVPCLLGLPRCTRGKEPICQCRRLKRCGFNPWVRKNPWRRKWEPTPVFLPGGFHWKRSLVGYSPWGLTESDMTEWLSIFTMSLCLGLSISCARWVRKELMMIEETVSRKGNSYWTLSVQSLCHFQLFATPWTTARQASLSITNSRSLLKLLPSPSPPASNLSQHQGLFKRVSSSHQVAKVLEFHLQHQSFQWTPRTDLL